MKPVQTEIQFGENSSDEGFSGWRQEQMQKCKALALSIGIPLGQEVEVWLAGEIRLRGKIFLEPNRWSFGDLDREKLRFRVQGVTFSFGEMTSCVRQD